MTDSAVLSTLTPEQLRDRASALGGSDCAAALGLSRFKTCRQLYHEKRGELLVDREETQWMWLGRAFEPIVRQWYAESSNRVVQQPTGTLRHPSHAFLVAHIDGFSVEGSHFRGYEGKSAVRSSGWGMEGSDQIPSDAFFQTQHYMLVTGFEVFDVVCLIGGARIASYEVRADAELQQYILEAELEFWRMVESGTPPTLDYQHRTAIDMLKRLYPGTTGARITASDDAILWRHEMEEAAALETTAKKAKLAYKARLLELMGDSALLDFPDGKSMRRQTIDKEAYWVGPQSYMDTRFVNTPS